VRDRLPTIAIPLRHGDVDVPLDLGAVFKSVYDRGRYGNLLTYDQSLPVELSERDREWVRSILGKR
jgi:hypothetical protein